MLLNESIDRTAFPGEKELRNSMELDDFKAAWQSLDRRLAEQNALALHVFKDNKLAQAKSLLRPLVWGQVAQLLAGIAMVMLFAPFWVKYMRAPHLLIAGLSLQAYALMFIVFAARELHLIGSIDYAAPVLTIQKQLATLRNWRIRMAPLFGITGCFIWIPLMLVIFKSLGADVWVKSPEVVYWFLASGFASLGIMLAIWKWSRHPSLVKVTEDYTAGRSLQRAQSVLDEVARFEHE